MSDYISMLDGITEEELDELQQEAKEQYERDCARLEAIKDISDDRLRELAEAEREGRIHISRYPNCKMCEWVTKIMFANIEPCVSCKSRALAEPKGEATT